MSVDALQSLIQTCSTTKPIQAQKPLRKECAPIASLGFWADSSVPLSVGADSLSTGVKITQPDQQLSATSLEVRGRLTEAKALADVGDNIRWDVILEEAAKLSCGMRAGPTCTEGLKKAYPSDDEDRRSTSASGSGEGEVDDTEMEASSNDESDDSGSDTACRTKSFLPPWRRSPATSVDSDQMRSSTAPPPWRRGATKRQGSAPVYTIATMLQYRMLTQQTSSDIVEAKVPDAASGELQQKASVPVAPERSLAASASSRQDAPWRRHPRASSSTESCVSGASPSCRPRPWRTGQKTE